MQGDPGMDKEDACIWIQEAVKDSFTIIKRWHL